MGNDEMAVQPKVTVIIPVFNGGDYVKGCCEQLQRQTLDSIEIILVNDGSTDSTAQLCDEMAMTYPNMRALHSENKGVSVARNMGIAEASGEYIAFFDVDDMFDSDILEYEYKLAKDYDADVVCLDSSRGAESGVPLVLVGPQEAVSWLLDKKIAMSCCNKLFRNERVSQDFFPAGVKIYEDFAALYRALCQSSRVVYAGERKYYYIRREGSGSRAPLFSEKYFDAIGVIDEIVEDVKLRFPALVELAEARRAMVYLRISKIYWLRGAPAEHREQIDIIRERLASVPSSLVKRYFIRNDIIRLCLYLHHLPLFRLMLKIIDRS